jgi:transposase
VFALRSERRLCSEVRVNLAYRWFCRLSVEDKIPDHSVFSRARHERFRESNALAKLALAVRELGQLVIHRSNARADEPPFLRHQFGSQFAQ